jgi:hypothetical protein
LNSFPAIVQILSERARRNAVRTAGKWVTGAAGTNS